MTTSALRITRYGAIAGAIVGTGLTLVVALVYAYFAVRAVPDSAGRALAGTMLVGAVLAFPTSVPLLNGLTSVAVRSNALLTIAVLLMPLVNGVVLGVA